MQLMDEWKSWFRRLSLEVLETLYGWIEDELRERHRHHHHHRRIRGSTIIVGLQLRREKGGTEMANTIATNQLLPLIAGASMSDGTIEDLQQADATATVAWSEDSNGAIIKLSATAGFEVDAAAVATGTANVTAAITLTDARTFTAVLAIQVTAVAVTITGVTIIPGTPTLQ